MTDPEALVRELTDRLGPVEVDLGRAWWDASTQASDKANQRKADRELARRRIQAAPGVSVGG